MNHQRPSVPLTTIALSLGLVCMLAYHSFGGATRTVVIEPAVVATVNIETVYEAVPQKAAAQRSLEDFGRSLDETGRRLLEEIDLLEADIEGLPPGTERYEQANAELMQKSLEYEGFVRFANNRLELEKAEALKSIYVDLKKTVASLAASNGYDIVFVDDTIGELVARTEQEMQRQISARRMLYGGKSIDITDLVIEEMNAQR